MKRMMFVLCGLLALVLNAEYLKNPDANTLWLEDGKGEFKGWRDTLVMTSRDDGGFTIETGSKVDGGRYVDCAPGYDWLVFEIDSIEHKPGYRGFFMTPFISMVANPYQGIFAVKRVIDKKSAFLRVDMHGLKLGFKYMKQVKVPENYIDYKWNGEGMDITVYLKEPAEDVSIAFYDSYCMPQVLMENKNKVQLLPKDEDNAVVWTGSIKKFGYSGKGALMLKATVLGGGIKVPIWTTIPKAESEKKK